MELIDKEMHGRAWDAETTAEVRRGRRRSPRALRANVGLQRRPWLNRSIGAAVVLLTIAFIPLEPTLAGAASKGTVSVGIVLAAAQDRLPRAPRHHRCRMNRGPTR